MKQMNFLHLKKSSWATVLASSMQESIQRVMMLSKDHLLEEYLVLEINQYKVPVIYSTVMEQLIFGTENSREKVNILIQWKTR